MNRRRIGMPGLSSSGSRDPAGQRRFRGMWRRAAAVAGTVVMVAGMLALGAPAASATGQPTGGSESGGSAAQTTRDYVIRYWSRWTSFYQQEAFGLASGANTLAGPEIPMGPQFRVINAINDDTIYASSLFLDL